MTYSILNTATKQTVAAGLSLSEVRTYLREAGKGFIFLPCKL